jgi:hypothetical protein
VQRCLVCRYVQETATGDADDRTLSSKEFGKLLLRTCPSLPNFLRTPCSEAAAAVSSSAANPALNDICHAAKVCSVSLIDPFESAKLLASSCEPSRCTIHHHVSRPPPLLCHISLRRVQVRHSITAGNMTLLPASTATRMPRIAHFIFGLSPDFGRKPFSLVHYLAIRSAHDRLGPKWRIFVGD